VLPNKALKQCFTNKDCVLMLLPAKRYTDSIHLVITDNCGKGC